MTGLLLKWALILGGWLLAAGAGLIAFHEYQVAATQASRDQAHYAIVQQKATARALAMQQAIDAAQTRRLATIANQIAVFAVRTETRAWLAVQCIAAQKSPTTCAQMRAWQRPDHALQMYYNFDFNPRHSGLLRGFLEAHGAPSAHRPGESAHPLGGAVPFQMYIPGGAPCCVRRLGAFRKPVVHIPSAPAQPEPPLQSKTLELGAPAPAATAGQSLPGGRLATVTIPGQPADVSSSGALPRPAPSMTPAQIAQAQQEASAWWKAHHKG